MPWLGNNMFAVIGAVVRQSVFVCLFDQPAIFP
jgi:hypothetical protein